MSRMECSISDGEQYEEPSYPEQPQPDPDDLIETLRDIALTGLGEGFYRKIQGE